MFPTVPQSVTACVIRGETAPEIVREARTMAAEGFRIVLNAEQVGAVVAWCKAMERDAELLCDEVT